MKFESIKWVLPLLVSVLWSQLASAATYPFALHIQGSAFNTQERLAISDIGEGKTHLKVNFKSKGGKAYVLDMQYKKLAANRSYPANLDITVKDAQGHKFGYLFFALNRLAFLKQVGVFGFKVDIDGEPVDVQFVWSGHKKGHLQTKDLTQERFFQDTLVPKWGFQMIRPVVLKAKNSNTLSVTYNLDEHPYAVNYTIVNRANGGIRFKHQLYRLLQGQQHLVSSIYFNADDLKTLREVMYAGKHFDANDGVFKLVFYPALGQTEPKNIK